MTDARNSRAPQRTEATRSSEARRVLPRPLHQRILHLPGRLSLVWILPLLAVLFAGVMLWQSYVDRGPLITISFENASGVIAGETRVMNNDVVVGQVERVRLGSDLSRVLLDVRMSPQVAPWIDEDARFWVVNARINTTEISGLGTLLSGAYIGVDWDVVPEERQYEFQGLEEPPLTKRGTPGLRVTLDADEAGYVYVGTPVFYRQLEVGRVERRRLALDGQRVLFDIFIESPYHRHVHESTRFFGVSGAEAVVDSDGATFRLESMSAFFTGGVAFENVEGVKAVGATTLKDGVRFHMYDNRGAARDSLFDGDVNDDRFRYSAVFEGPVKGLKVGAPIEYQGLRVGQVIGVSALPPPSPDDSPRTVAELQIQPKRLGMEDISAREMLNQIQLYVERGMRVQLASGNLLTGQLLVKMVMLPDAGPGTIDLEAKPYPALPSLPYSADALTGDVETLVKNLSELPLESLVVAATDLLRDARAVVGAPGVQQLPQSLNQSLDAFANTIGKIDAATAELPALMKSLNGTAGNAEALMAGMAPGSRLYVELSSTVRELRAAARSIATFAELLERNPNALITGR